MRTLVWATFIVVAALCAPAVAEADADARSRALELNKQAQAQFEAGEYETAAATFAQAFELYPEPRILLGETIAWFKAGSCDRALPLASRYMRESSDASQTDRANVSKIQAECAVRAGRAKLEAGDLAGAEVELRLAERLDLHQGAARSIAELATELDHARAEAHDEPGPEPTERAVVSPPPKSSSAGPRIVGWTLVGVGASAAIAGLALRLSYLNAYKGYEADNDACTQAYRPECGNLHSRYDELESRRNRTQVPQAALLVGAGVLGAVGLTLALWPRNGGEAIARLSVSAGGVALSLPVTLPSGRRDFR